MYLRRQGRRSRQTAEIRHHAQGSTSPVSSVPIQYQHQTRSSEIRLISQHLGRLFKERGAPSYHGDSYFGSQSAAVMMEATTPEMSSFLMLDFQISLELPLRNHSAVKEDPMHSSGNWLAVYYVKKPLSIT